MMDALLVASQHVDAKFFEPAPLNGGDQRSGSFGAIFGSLSLPQGFSLGSDEGRSGRLAFDEPPGVLAPENRAGLDAYLCRAKKGVEQLARAQERASKVRQFREETQWLSENRNRFSGKWVAIRGGQLLAAGDTAKDVFQKIADEKTPPLVTLVADDDLPFAGW